MSTLQIVLLVLASASTAGLAWTLHRNTVLRRRHDRALYLASHDRLTGLRTRAVLLADLTRLHAAGRPILLAIVNVDQFAQINRWCGYRGGDQLLTLLAGVTQHQASLHRGAAYRLGRDEMAVLWPDQTAADSDALTAALLAALNRPVEVALSRHSIDVGVTASMGLAAITGRGTPPGPIVLGRANTALQVAKRTRGVAVLWQPGMPVLERRRTAADTAGDDTHREESQS
ncbi:GGDEF domain-containing protein [Dactylosporangium sp. CA-152071]|uniref:GGDEF domain-containing protein n=1 Tax=Dactylosporangium sp. CA-152071 TaxID=3239933 RepID=UPI003D8CB11B